MLKTRKNHHASADYVAAKALLEERLGDGEWHDSDRVFAEAERRGIEFKAFVRAVVLMNLVERIDKETRQDFFRLPKVRRPSCVTRRAWALDYLRMALSAGEQEEYALWHEARDYDVGYLSFLWAKRRLGVRTRKEYIPVDGTGINQIIEYWRLPVVE